MILPAQAMAITDSSGQVVDTGVQCRIQPARHTVGENETMHIVVYCAPRANEASGSANEINQNRARLQFRSDQLTKSATDRQTVLGPERISGNDAGRTGDECAGDGIYTDHGRDGSHGRRTLHSGTQWVTLQFYGKVLHDRDIAGPYLLRGTQDTGQSHQLSQITPFSASCSICSLSVSTGSR